MEEDIYTYRRALEDFKWARSKAQCSVLGFNQR